MMMSSSSFALLFLCYPFLTGLGMENIGGIFVVLICGLIVAIFMAMLEFLWTLRHSEATEVNRQRVWPTVVADGTEFTGSSTYKSNFTQNLGNPTWGRGPHRRGPRADTQVHVSSPLYFVATEKALNFWVSDSSMKQASKEICEKCIMSDEVLDNYNLKCKIKQAKVPS